MALASRPQVFENWPVKFCVALEKFFGKRFFVFVKTFFFGDRLKNFCEDLFFFGEHLRLYPWSLALSILVLGLESVCPRKGCPWPWPRALCPRLHLCTILMTVNHRNWLDDSPPLTREKFRVVIPKVAALGPYLIIS